MDIACSYCQIPINVKKDTWFYIHEPGKPDTSAHQRCYAPAVLRREAPCSPLDGGGLGRGKGVGRLVERSPSVPRRDRGHLDQLIRF